LTHGHSRKLLPFDFGWGSAPDPAGRAYSASPGPLAECKVPTSKGRKDRKEGQGRGKGKGEYRREGEEREKGGEKKKAEGLRCGDGRP